MTWNKKRWFLRNFGFGKKAAEEESIEETESKETSGEETSGEETASEETAGEETSGEETAGDEAESGELNGEEPESEETSDSEDEPSDIQDAELAEGLRGPVEPVEEYAGNLQYTDTEAHEKPAEAKYGAAEAETESMAAPADERDAGITEDTEASAAGMIGKEKAEETAGTDAGAEETTPAEALEKAAEAEPEDTEFEAAEAEETVSAETAAVEEPEEPGSEAAEVEETVSAEPAAVEKPEEPESEAAEAEETTPAEALEKAAEAEPEDTGFEAAEAEETVPCEITEKVIPAAEDAAAENTEETTAAEEETKAMEMEKAEDALETMSIVTENAVDEESELKASVQGDFSETIEKESTPEEQIETAEDEEAAAPAEEPEAPAEEQAAAPAEEGNVGDVSLDSLEPADVFGFFRQIASIPHGSYHTEAISDYLEEFAKERNLEYMRDAMGNLIISRPGSAGCEDAEPIALQGHIDMVCEKEDSIDIDMDTQAITLMTDGKWLTADRTTLGGDDGIAVAIMLALLDDKNLKCPPLECIFTVDEEVGLLGATEIDLSSLKSRKMINLDSEEEGIITASCAGGAEMVCTLSGKRKMKGGVRATLEVSGLTGGHSGEKIAEERGNAVLILARLLYRLGKEGKYCICSLEGGRRNNAIPRSARAEILFTGKVKRKNILAEVRNYADEVKAEFAGTDPEMNISVELSEKGIIEHGMAFKRSDSMRIVHFLMLIPNGVIEYVPGYGDIPRTSLSLGIAETTESGFRTNSLVRSSMNSRKEMVMDKIFCLAEEFDASVDVQGAYPAWELVVESDFRKLAKDVYSRVTGKEAVVNFIHAGLECGILSAKVEGLECISIGPDMEEVHTPAEKLDIASSGRIYAFVKELLAECADNR